MLFEYFQQNFQIFIIIFSRIFGLLLVLPVISLGVPAMARAGLSFFIALLSAPVIININILPDAINIVNLGLALLGNFLVGLSIGFIVQVTVSAVQMSSSVFSTTMGLTFSENIDPLTQNSLPSIGNLLSVAIMLLFIRTESHIMFIEIIIRSFKELPIITEHAMQGLYISMKSSTAIILVLALKISLPIIGITLLLDIAMGIIGRIAPQFNVMIMGWNIKILIGFIGLWLIIPGILDFGTVLFQELHDSVLLLLAIANKGN